MSRHITKPISIIENMVRSLQRAKQYDHEAKKGMYAQPISEAQRLENITYAQKRLHDYIEKVSRVRDYSAGDKGQEDILMGF